MTGDMCRWVGHKYRDATLESKIQIASKASLCAGSGALHFYSINCLTLISFISKMGEISAYFLKLLKRLKWDKSCKVLKHNWGKWSEVTQLCPTLCNPMDCSPPGSLVPGIFQAWILEWVAISFSRGSSQPRDRTQVSHIVGRHFTIWAK